jgi:hypothetical protein
VTKISLAFGILLGEDVSETLLFVADLSGPSYRVPLGSGFSCFHFWHELPLLRPQGTRTPWSCVFEIIPTGWF